MHRFDVKTIKNVELRPKPFKTTKLQKWSNYDELHRFDVKTKKMLSYVQTFKTAKLQKWSNYDELHRFDVKTIKNVELRPKPFQTQQNYKSDQITMNCIDLTSKRTKMLSYVANHSKQRKTTKVIKLQWIASIWCQNDKKCWVTSQTIPNKQNYKSDQITMNCIDLTSKRSKMLSYVPNHSKHSKTTKVIKLRWIGSIWRQNDKKCWVTSQTIQNNSNLQK